MRTSREKRDRRKERDRGNDVCARCVTSLKNLIHITIFITYLRNSSKRVQN
jgi:hypothetical protein